ncbi:MAG TPA: STAS domain-containing protein [Solirubrobacteraceae bacterium]|nr:STAS domain-containing protein [Solirubrobacteraceae bacterium]
MTSDLGLDCELRGTTAELALNGDLDMAAAFKLEPAIERVVSQNDVDELVLDLEGVRFIDSAGLGSLLSTHERLHDLGIKSTITRPSEAVERVLAASGTRAVLID